ncbi:hypothetical protein ACKX2L_11085 [Lachnospiraceae bacterium YH-ros2228]
MKEGMKKRFALLLAAVFALTLVFNVTGANAETPTGSTYNTPTGSTYNTPTDNTDRPAKHKSLIMDVYYVDKSGNVGISPSNQKHVTYTKGMTAEDLYKALGIDQMESEVAQTYQGEKFTGFVYSPSMYFTGNYSGFLDKNGLLDVLKREIVESDQDFLPDYYFSAYPTYGDKILWGVNYVYPAEARFGYKEDWNYFLLDKDINDPQTFVKGMENFTPNDMTSGLNYSWTADAKLPYVYTKTTNFQVIYDILDPNEVYDPQQTILENVPKADSETLKSQIVEEGSKITLPSSIGGKAVRWLNVTSFNGSKPSNTLISGTTYTVHSNMSFQAVWETDQPLKVTKEQKEEYISSIESTVKYLKSHPNQGTIPYYVPMGLATVVPKEYLEAVKGHDIDLDLDMGAYNWTINGKEIRETSDINLEVSVKNAVPSDAVASLAGSKATKQISLAHEGPLGFDATLTWNVGEENQDKFANLYWYKPDGTFEYISRSEIDKDGNAKLKFTHASDYVIVLSDKPMGAEDATAANDTIIEKKIAENTVAETTASATTKTTVTSTATKATTLKTKSAKPATKSPKTGEF